MRNQLQVAKTFLKCICIINSGSRDDVIELSSTLVDGFEIAKGAIEKENTAIVMETAAFKTIEKSALVRGTDHTQSSASEPPSFPYLAAHDPRDSPQRLEDPRAPAVGEGVGVSPFVALRDLSAATPNAAHTSASFVWHRPSSDVGMAQRLVNSKIGAVVAERLDFSPPTKMNQVQSLEESVPNFHKWESCRTMPRPCILALFLPRSSTFQTSLRPVQISTQRRTLYCSDASSPQILHPLVTSAATRCSTESSSIVLITAGLEAVAAYIISVARSGTFPAPRVTLRDAMPMNQKMLSDQRRNSIPRSEVSMEQRCTEGRGKRDIPEKTRRPATSSGTIPTYKNPKSGIERGSPRWEASSLTTTPPGPSILTSDALESRNRIYFVGLTGLLFCRIDATVTLLFIGLLLRFRRVRVVVSGSSACRTTQLLADVTDPHFPCWRCRQMWRRSKNILVRLAGVTCPPPRPVEEDDTCRKCKNIPGNRMLGTARELEKILGEGLRHYIYFRGPAASSVRGVNGREGVKPTSEAYCALGRSEDSRTLWTSHAMARHSSLRDTYKSSRLADVVWKAFPIWRRRATYNDTACFSMKRQVRTRVFETSYGMAGLTSSKAGVLTMGPAAAVDRWSLLTSRQGEPGSIPGQVTPGFSHVGIVPDDAAGRRVFSGISRFPPPLHSGATHYSPQSFSSALKTSVLRAAQIHLFTHSPKQAGVILVGISISIAILLYGTISCSSRRLIGHTDNVTVLKNVASWDITSSGLLTTELPVTHLRKKSSPAKPFQTSVVRAETLKEKVCETKTPNERRDECWSFVLKHFILTIGFQCTCVSANLLNTNKNPHSQRCGSIDAVHNEVSTLEINLRNKSLPHHAYIVGALRDIRQVTLVKKDSK
ncbi:hypothetical protein PR048_008073 [Dryococelus australis]|uniref:Uncharacterized protein n=1 Tax=Dryococelus australis TaxID=614101 RepID=A0ABQ9HW21_9NEOP|nr:hypothetical protein PR048_008073 [Dryococelus australis]